MSDLIQYNAFENLRVRKYVRDVFHDNLWHTDPLLLESRGHVLDENDKLVARPFKKIFNYQENGTTIDPDTEIVKVEKVNGFMFHVTEQWNGTLIEGTTGSLHSPFTELAKENMKKHNVNYDAFSEFLLKYGKLITCIFEIKDNEKDPHIIDDESDGVYLLGARIVSTGQLIRQDVLDKMAKQLNVKRPKWEVCFFRDALKEVAGVKHEGFVIYDFNTHEGLLKLKSPYYISKKSLMRKKAEFVFNPDYKKLVDEEYYPIIEKIREMFTVTQWSVLDEQSRGHVFNTIYKANILSTDEMIKMITNHPELSYNLKDDVIKINYDYNANYYITTIDMYKIQTPEMFLVRNGEWRGVGDNFSDAIRNLYIDVFVNSGDYEYLNDFSLHAKSQLRYYAEITEYTDAESDNLRRDIDFYCK